MTTDTNPNVRTLSYSYEVGGGEYTISKTVRLPENTPSVYVKIEGWSNGRYLYIDRKNGVSYFQASAEGTECHRCGICQKRMKSIGWRTGHDFVEIYGRYSLYQMINGVPEDTTSGTLGRFLGLPVI